MSSNGQPPDLASILHTLAGLNSQKAQQQAQSQPQAAVQAQLQPSHEYQQAWQQQLDIAAQGSKPSTPINAPPKVVDPASILEWSAGLRCVMKTVAKHDNIINEIRRVCVPIRHLFISTTDTSSDDQGSTRA